MHELAKEKGESPTKWILRTIALWVGIELSVFFTWYTILGWNLMLVGAIILSIIVARIAFYFLKRELNQMSDIDLEDRINEIGKGEA